MKKIILIIVAVATIICLAMAVNKVVNTKNQPDNSFENNIQESVAEPEPSQVKEEKQPNALDVLAPGYENANDKLQKIKDLREQALNEQQEDLDNIRY